MSAETMQFEELLRRRNFSVTKPRRRLFALLQTHKEITIKRLVSLLNDQDQATVYRNILVFEELGIIRRLHLGWKSKLELSDLFHEHHHHATCTNCGTVTALQEDLVLENNLRQLASRNNFTLQDHTVEIRGLCPACHQRLVVTSRA